MQAIKKYFNLIFCLLCFSSALIAERFINDTPTPIKVTILNSTEDHEITQFTLAPDDDKFFLLLPYRKKGVVLSVKQTRNAARLPDLDAQLSAKGHCFECGDSDCRKNRDCSEKCKGVIFQVVPCDMNKNNKFHVVAGNRGRLDIKVTTRD